MSSDSTNGWAAKLGDQHPEIAGILKLLEEFGKESERGVVLIMAGFLEEQLKDLLVGYLRDTPSTRELLDGPFVPLSSFSARTHACYALGLINDDEYHDLKLIRKIRNDFAHKLDASFNDQRIKSLCSKFRCEVHPIINESDALSEPSEPDTRTRYTAPAITIIFTLWQRLQEVEEHRLRPVEWKRR